MKLNLQSTSSVEGLLAPARRPLTVGLALLITMVAFEALAVATAMPAVLADLGGIRLYGWAFSAFMLTSLVGTALAGTEIDRVGPAAPLGVALTLLSAGLMIVAAAPSMVVVVAGRAVQGLGAGAIPPVAYAAIGRAYPASLRPRMFAVLASAWVVPGLVGPGLAGVAAEHVGWRAVFAGVVPLVVVAAILVLPALVRLGPATATEATPSVLGAAVRVALGAGMFLAGLEVASPGAAVVLTVTGLVVGFPALRLLLPPGILRGRTPVAAAVAARATLVLPFFGAEVFVPLMLTSVRHRSTTVAGLVLTAATLSWTAGSWIQARLAHRWTHRRLGLTGAALVVVAVGAVASVLAASVPVWVAAAAWAVGGFGMGLAYAQGSLVVLAATEESGAGRATAALTLAETLAVALATGAAGALVSAGERLGWGRAGGILAVDLVMVAAGAAGLVAAARLPARRASG